MLVIWLVCGQAFLHTSRVCIYVHMYMYIFIYLFPTFLYQTHPKCFVFTMVKSRKFIPFSTMVSGGCWIENRGWDGFQAWQCQEKNAFLSWLWKSVRAQLACFCWSWIYIGISMSQLITPFLAGHVGLAGYGLGIYIYIRLMYTYITLSRYTYIYIYVYIYIHKVYTCIALSRYICIHYTYIYI